jgi:hypothetical protein
MADIADIEVALVSAVSAALYPDGTTAPSVPGPDCRIYRGWPSSAALDGDLSVGTINVTVFASGDPGRTMTRYVNQWGTTATRSTLTATVERKSVTFAGVAAAGQIAGVSVNNQAFAYRIRAGDSCELVAANLASLIRGNSIVTLSGATLTIPGATQLLARVVADGSAQQEVRRQEQDFRVSCWCPTPASRDSTASAIDCSFSNILFLSLSDGTRGRLTYISTGEFDQSQNARLFRRDLIYRVEFAAIITLSCPAMLFGDLVLNNGTYSA